MSLIPSSFSSFVMSYIKVIKEFGLTLTHVSLKFSPNASCVDQNVCNNFMKEIFPIPPAPQTCSTIFCSALYWAFRQQLMIQYKKLIQPIFLSYLAYFSNKFGLFFQISTDKTQITMWRKHIYFGTRVVEILTLITLKWKTCFCIKGN